GALPARTSGRRGGFTRESEDAAASDDILAQVWWRTVRAKVLARSGKAEQAVRLAREAVELTAPSDHLVLKGQALEALGETLAVVGNPGEARRILGQAAEAYAAKGDVIDARRALERVKSLQPPVTA